MAQFYKSRLFRQFLPFMLLVVGGSLLVKEFIRIRFKYRKVISFDISKEVEARGIKMKKPVSLEEEYENTMRKLDIDNWENVRIPRPWDETSSTNN